MSKSDVESIKELNKLLKLSSPRKQRAVNKWVEMAKEEGISQEMKMKYINWAEKELLQQRNWVLIIGVAIVSAVITLALVWNALLIGYLQSILIQHGIPF